eukprot:scaffold161014_cov16-Tisochrysis_lutea.AAC.2
MALLLCWGLSHIVLGHECCATEDLCQMTLGEHGVKLMKGTGEMTFSNKLLRGHAKLEETSKVVQALQV